MLKGIFAAGVCLTACLGPLPGAAQDSYGSGCAALGDAVSISLRAALEASAGERLPPAALRQAGPRALSPLQYETCGSTAAAASAAFSRTLAAFTIEVEWHDGGLQDRGDWCLSHYLSQCYPELADGGGPAAATSGLVRDAWRGVLAGLERAMPLGVQSDISRFRSQDLVATLAVSLGVTLAAPRRGASSSGGSSVLQR